MMESLPHTWTEDVREPLFQFTYDNQRYGFFLFSIPMWIELLTVIVGFALLATLFSFVLYYTVVKCPRTTTAYILGFGVYVPFWIFVPRLIVSMVGGVQNKIFLFCACVISPNTSLFRTSEAMFGFTPEHAKQSASSFALYFGSPMLLIYDTKSQKHVKATPGRILYHLQRFSMLAAAAGLFQSLFVIWDLFPPLNEPTPDNWYHLDQIVNPQMWIATALYGVLFQVYLYTYGEGLVFFTTLVTQKQTIMLMDNPMFESQSVSEFWGKRWNSLIHFCLKNGIYKPVRSLGGSRELSVVASFVASGLFHEWIMPTVMYDVVDGIPPGTTCLFFLWQALLISLEYTVGHWNVVTAVTRHLPPLVRSMLVVLLGVPLGHYFCDGYVHSNFFAHGHMTLCSILPLPP